MEMFLRKNKHLGHNKRVIKKYPSQNIQAYQKKKLKNPGRNLHQKDTLGHDLQPAFTVIPIIFIIPLRKITIILTYSYRMISSNAIPSLSGYNDNYNNDPRHDIDTNHYHTRFTRRVKSCILSV